MTIDRTKQPAAPSNPYVIAKAYGVKTPVQAATTPALKIAASASAPQSPRQAAGSPGVRPPTGTNRAPVNPGIAKLIGAAVPGGVDFAANMPARAPGALPLYSHPSRHNEAATAVRVGRTLDTTG